MLTPANGTELGVVQLAKCEGGLKLFTASELNNNEISMIKKLLPFFCPVIDSALASLSKVFHCFSVNQLTIFMYLANWGTFNSPVA